MSLDPRQFSAMFSIDVSADPRTEASNQSKIDANELIVTLLRQMVETQKQEIKLLEEISNHLSQGQNAIFERSPLSPLFSGERARVRGGHERRSKRPTLSP